MVRLYKHSLGMRDVFNVKKSWLEQYGYTEDADPKKYDRSAVIEKLKQLSETKSEYEDELILWWEPVSCEGENYHKVYLAGPVLTALLLKEYEIAEKLIDQGYYANDLLLPEQIYYEKTTYGYGQYVPIYISQILMSAFDMPQTFFEKLCEQQVADNFSYLSDYWNNPFLLTSEGIVERKRVPGMEGFRAISEYNPELLSEMMSNMEDNVSLRDWFFLYKKEWEKLITQLAVYFWGMPDNIVGLNQSIIYHMDCAMSRIEFEIGTSAYFLWIRLLPQLMQACGDDRKSKNVIWGSAYYQYYRLHGETMPEEQLKEKVLKRLEKCLYKHCPQGYTVLDFMEWMLEYSIWGQYADLLMVWKYCMKKKIQIDKKEPVFWNLIFNVLDVPRVGRDLAIREGIRILELIDSSEWTDDEEDVLEPNDFVFLAYSIMNLDSEELLLTCIQKRLLTKSATSALIKCALVFRKKNLLPVLLSYKHKE